MGVRGIHTYTNQALKDCTLNGRKAEADVDAVILEAIELVVLHVFVM